jgi:hypothetical protein
MRGIGAENGILNEAFPSADMPLRTGLIEVTVADGA